MKKFFRVLKIRGEIKEGLRHQLLAEQFLAPISSLRDEVAFRRDPPELQAIVDKLEFHINPLCSALVHI